MPHATPGALLAQAGQASREQVVDIVLIAGLLIVAVIVLGVIAEFARRRFLHRQDHSAEGGSFLTQLQGMRDRGEMSQEEFDAARRRLVAKISGTTPDEPAKREHKPSPAQRPRAGDRIAEEGFDLTGAPLPRPLPRKIDESGSSEGGDQRPEPGSDGRT